MQVISNPQVSQVAAVVANSTGLVQGFAAPNFAVERLLSGGINADTVPIVGGTPITETTTANVYSTTSIAKATSNAAITGFSVSNQGDSMVVGANSTAPQASVGRTVNFYRLGSKAHIAVKCDPALVATLQAGVPSNQQVSWDFTNNQVIAYSAGIGALNARIVDVSTKGNDKVITYDTGTTNSNYGAGNCIVIEI